MKKVKKILYPSITSSISPAVMEFAKTFVKLYNAKFFVLNAIDISLFEGITFESNDFYKSSEEIARMNLNRYLEENFNDFTEIFHVVKFGDPNEEIIRFINDEEIDLIIVSSERNSMEMNFDQDDFAESLLSQTDIPVLFINNSGNLSTNSNFENIDKKFLLNNFGLTLFN